jgi:hypothetical protein
MEDFTQINGRQPVDSEIIDNLKDQLDIDQIKQIIEQISNENTNLTNKHALSIDVSESPV